MPEPLIVKALLVQLLPLIVALGAVFTFIVILLLVTLAGLGQLALLVKNAVTTSLLFKEEVVKDAPVVTLLPLTFHCIVGDAPPFVIFELKVILEPEQILALPQETPVLI